MRVASGFGGTLVLAVLAALLLMMGCASTAHADDWLGGRAPSVVTHATHAERLTDRRRPNEGEAWNSDATSTIQLSGGVEWDLGAPRVITRAILQGDNNDVYALLVSDDGHQWRSLWEAPAVAESGLRSRENKNLRDTARFVRLEPRGGDGSYGVAEVGVFGPASAPSPAWSTIIALPDGGDAVLANVVTLGLATLIALIALPLAAFAGVEWRRRVLPRLVVPRLVWVALAGALLVSTALVYRARYRHNTIDDAYISFQYAKNWALGHGLVFNPGERVEGFTNFLWVALLTPLWWIVGDDATRFTGAAFGLSLSFAVLSLGLMYGVARRAFSSELALALSLLLVAFDDAFVSYAVFSLENHLLIAALLAGLFAQLAQVPRASLLTGLSFAAVVMTRPDAALWPATFFLTEAAALVALEPTTRRARLKELGVTLLSFALPYTAYFAARYAYYGHPLPNTFYLKVAHDLAAVPRGLDYVSSYLAERYYLPALALTGLLAWRKPWVRWALAYAVVHVAYVIHVGGDFYSGHRFLLALTPILALLTGAGVDAVAARLTPWFQFAASIPLALACVALRFGTVRDGPARAEIEVWHDVVDNAVRYAHWFRAHARPGASMALGDIGGAGLFSNLAVVDIYGVVDTQLAHQKVQGLGTGKAGHEKVMTPADVLARRPSYIKLGFVNFAEVPPGYYNFDGFPPSIDVDGVLVRDDLATGQTLPSTVTHFDASELVAWKREGDAFADVPSLGAVGNQRPLAFASGSLVNSFGLQTGDAATGTLRSPPFQLQGDRMRLLVGGGRNPERLRVSLWVDGQRVFNETGTNHEVLGRREWDIAPYRGRFAELEVVDQETGAWGHILLDEVSQWSGRPNATGKL